MRQAVTALLAVPVTLATRGSAHLRQSTRSRVGLALGLAFVLGVGVLGPGQPAPTVATRTTPILPLAEAAFTTRFSADRGLKEPVTIAFSTPMDTASVAAALTVEPARPVDLSWDATRTTLTVSPRGRWDPATFNTVTVPAGALATSGQPLAQPARAIFFTRYAATAAITPTATHGARASLTTTFRVDFSRAVDLDSVQDAIRLDPPAPGTIRSIARPDGPPRFEFTPSGALRPDTTYRLVVSGARDSDGLLVDDVALAIRTVKPPAVVRFRPFDDSTGIGRDAALSVRFTRAMERTSTAKAFSVSVGGKPVKGSVRWAEDDKVLVFTPKAALPYGAKVSMRVESNAKDTTGVPLAADSRATFRTAKKGVEPATDTSSGGGSRGGLITGGAVGGGNWAAVETYYLGLMNCTRTGGWVTSTGKCSSPGGRNVAPLRLSAGISSKVARPYARRLAVGGACTHFIGGSPGDRLRRAGYSSYRWAENIGCRSGGARSAVLSSHLFFQSEKSYNGGHYVNMMSAKYTQVGIGVWVSGGRVRLVVDFYHP